MGPKECLSTGALGILPALQGGGGGGGGPPLGEGRDEGEDEGGAGAGFA